MMKAVRRDLPSGTVTMLFTDVEGSTKLLRELGAERYAGSLATHRRALRQAFAAEGGVEVDTQGDAFFVAFTTARGAVRAAARMVETLAPGRIRVRVGIHTGTPRLDQEGYVGVDVHRAARIAACGHGDQVLVSAATAALVVGEELRDLGEHRLNDLSAPERIYQLGDVDFPPLKSLYRTNLPISSTSFLGRSTELAGVLALLSREDVRLVTLTGPGGIGKTRLGMQAAAAAAERYPDGVFWVSLAALRDPELVLEAARNVLDAKEGLAEHIAGKSLLLLLDNFEHVVAAGVAFSELLAACPRLHLLVTSRELLRVPGEHAYPVPVLEPQDATELFVTRARAALPSFDPSAAVQELCSRLDNLPLALELAAARIRVLSPEQLVERLSRRLDLLRGGPAVDPRQQTLRATIEWSYDLLDRDEQLLFERLAVFVGGCTLRTAETICETEIDTLQSLVDKSLLPGRAGDRFWMLETIREYAHDRLEESGDAEPLRRRHLEHFLAVAEQAEPELFGSRQLDWLERLEQDYANLRAALAWGLRFAPNLALRLAAALRAFWYTRGYLSEGRRWLGEALAAPASDESARANALLGAGVLASVQGDWAEAKRLSVECRQLSLALGESAVAAEALLSLGRATLAEGDAERAAHLFEEAAALGREIGDERIVGLSRFNRGYLALSTGAYAQARTQLEAAKERFAAAEDRYGVARSLAALGSVALHERRHEDAVASLQESLTLSWMLGDRDDMTWALQLLAVAFSESQREPAARLLGAAEALRETLGIQLEGVELALHERALAIFAASPDATVVAAARSAGRDLSLDEAVELALALP